MNNHHPRGGGDENVFVKLEQLQTISSGGSPNYNTTMMDHHVDVLPDLSTHQQIQMPFQSVGRREYHVYSPLPAPIKLQYHVYSSPPPGVYSTSKESSFFLS